MKITQDRSELRIHKDARLHFIPHNIPQELGELNQWVPCYSIGDTDPATKKPITTPKRPVGPPTQSNFNQGQLLDIAGELRDDVHQHFGLILNADDNIAILDVDDLPVDFTEKDLPDTIRTLLRNFPTYSEISPSGQGLHVIYKVDKNAPDFDCYATAARVETTYGSMYLKDQFLTFTGHVFDESIKELKSIDPSILITFGAPTPPKESLQSTDPANLSSLALTPVSIDYNIDHVAQLLTQIPPSLSNHPSKARYFDAYAAFNNPVMNPSDYEHWRTVAAAVHHAAAMIGKVFEGRELFVKWSSLDRDNFEGYEQAAQKYDDNPPKNNGITVSTLRKLAWCDKPQWPKLDTKGHVIHGNVYNWEHLIHVMYSLQVDRNEITQTYRISGPQHVMKTYFGEEEKEYSSPKALAVALLSIAQSHYWPTCKAADANVAANHLIMKAGKFNPVKEAIDAEPPWTPEEGSHFQALWETITLRDDVTEEQQVLCRSYLKKNLMGIIRGHYYNGKFGGTTGMVIMMGPENAYKSTWIKGLLPDAFRGKYLGTSSLALKADMKELQMQAAQHQILLFDEVERILSRSETANQKSTDALIKNFLVQEHDMYRPLWSNENVSIHRKCIFFGTTNAPGVSITENGSRRIQIIPVQACDTIAQMNMNMMRVYKELQYEFENTPEHELSHLWNLTDAEIAMTNESNTRLYKESSNIEEAFFDLFGKPKDYPFEQLQRTHGLRPRWKELQVKKQFWSNTALMEELVKAGAGKMTLKTFKGAMTRILGDWSGTYSDGKIFGQGEILGGFYRQGRAKSGWITPPLIDTFSQLMAETEEEAQ